MVFADDQEGKRDTQLETQLLENELAAASATSSGMLMCVGVCMIIISL